MIISVSGLTGSGKNTLGELLAKKLSIRLVCPTFKDLAEKEAVSLMKFQKMAEADPKIDIKFDDYLKQEAKKGNCVITTWLSPWIVESDLKVRLFAPLEVRAKRISKRDGTSLNEAIEHVKKRDMDNRKRYLKLYNIDIFNEDVFDVSLNSGKSKPDELARIVVDILKVKKLK